MNKTEFYFEMTKLTKKLSDDDLVDLYNAYALDAGWARIYSIWDANRFYISKDMREGKYQEFSAKDYYFTVSENGFLQSFCELTSPKSPFDCGRLIDLVYGQRKSCGFEEIDVLLEQLEG